LDDAEARVRRWERGERFQSPAADADARRERTGRTVVVQVSVFARAVVVASESVDGSENAGDAGTGGWIAFEADRVSAFA